MALAQLKLRRLHIGQVFDRIFDLSSANPGRIHELVGSVPQAGQVAQVSHPESLHCVCHGGSVIAASRASPHPGDKGQLSQRARRPQDGLPRALGRRHHDQCINAQPSLRTTQPALELDLKRRQACKFIGLN